MPCVMTHKQGVFEWHQRGYLHRDIKPDNVRVNAEGDVVIIDANIATPISKCAHGKVTTKRKAAGTTGFMDPLVESGVYDLSPAAEVWNVGSMLGFVRRLHATPVQLLWYPCLFGSHRGMCALPAVDVPGHVSVAAQLA